MTDEARACLGYSDQVNTTKKCLKLQGESRLRQPLVSNLDNMTLIAIAQNDR